MADTECLCWVGHGDCGGCSGYPGIAHEPACGWEQNPDCPVHQFNWPDRVRDDLTPPKRTVRKVDGLWKVTNHPDGVVSWATHYDALLYATGRLERPGKGWRWPTADTAAVQKTISNPNLALYGSWLSTPDCPAHDIEKASTNLALYGESTATVSPLADGRNQVTVHDHQVGP